MSETEFGARMRERCIQLMTLVKENPVETIVLGMTAIAGVACMICRTGEVKEDAGIFNRTDEWNVANEVMMSEMRMIQPEGTYTWKEFGHMVREHDRHYGNGTVTHIPSYMKITGGKMAR